MEIPILDAIALPVMVVETGGLVRLANRAADRVFGRPVVGESLADLVADPPAEVTALLRRSARSGSPLVAAISPIGSGKPLRVWGRRLTADDPAVVLRIDLAYESEFSLLTEKVRQLNAEIVQRRRAQAVAEEMLRDNQLLLRELNHRVKNNIQMLASLFSARLRQPGPPELHEFIGSAVGRIMAIGSVQRLIYEDGRRAGVVSLENLLASIAASLRAIVPNSVSLHTDCIDIEVPDDQAQPVALIMNELITNALKHGVAAGGHVRAGAFRRGDELVLFVEDDGPGMPQPVKGTGSYGLLLVQGLARQIGGRIEYDNKGGLRCEVSFTPRRPEVST